MLDRPTHAVFPFNLESVAAVLMLFVASLLIPAWLVGHRGGTSQPQEPLSKSKNISRSHLQGKRMPFHPSNATEL